MAISGAQFAFGFLASGEHGTQYPMMLGQSVVTEVIVTSASNQVTTAVAPVGAQAICRVSVDIACHVAFGLAPDATTAAARFYIPAGGVEYFRIASGSKAAAVNA